MDPDNSPLLSRKPLAKMSATAGIQELMAAESRASQIVAEARAGEIRRGSRNLLA